jgi:sigma-B regulation protein RsbU (phosphoserine phosphatase)
MGESPKSRREGSGPTTRRARQAPVLKGVAENLYALQQDLEIARRIQEKLLPPKPELAGFDFDLFYQPAGEVGGDFYDFLPMADGRLGILVADASGKGLAGALLMVEARAILRTMTEVASSPREILVASNRVLQRDFEKGRFVSVFFAVLDPKKRTLTMASAGHTPLLICRERGREVVQVQPKGLILGAMPDARFRSAIDEEMVLLSPGDRFLLYTDGVSELMNPIAEEFGMSRLTTWLGVNAHLYSDDALRSLVDALELHRAGQVQSDDITIVTGRLDPDAR